MRGLAMVSVIIASSACSFSEVKDEAIVVDPTFSSISTNIFERKCLSCHGSTNPRDGVDLSSHARTIATAGVVAGSPTTSGLLAQVQSGAMPQGGSKLPDQHIQALSAWISNGALDN